jgi:hypothetical protein
VANIVIRPYGQFANLSVIVPVREGRNVSIDVYTEDLEINIPASGDITPEAARELARAILLAADLAEGTIKLEGKNG